LILSFTDTDGINYWEVIVVITLTCIGVAMLGVALAALAAVATHAGNDHHDRSSNSPN
jgi:hypothetical protein